MGSINFEPQINYTQTSWQVSDMIYRAARMAGALGPVAGQGPNPSESKEWLDILNNMIDGWKIEKLLMEYVRRTQQTTQVNQSSHSVGPGQDWDIERPEKILAASFLIQNQGTSGESEIQMEIVWNYERWQEIVVKRVMSDYPLALYYQAAVPYGVARLWPVPNQSPQEIAIYTAQLLSEFATVDDNVIMRDGFREMMMYNLAVAIHEVYPKGIMAPSVVEKADFYKQRVKAAQFTPLYVSSDDGARQNNLGEDWFGGTPRAWVPYT